MANILRCVFDSKVEWEIKDVTVYEDRAQVVRVLKYKTTDAGEAELKLINLPVGIVSESIRAEIASDNAVVAAVTSERVTGTPEKIEITEREEEIQERLVVITKEKRNIVERRALLHAYYDNMVPSTVLKPDTNDNFLFESISSNDNLTQFSEALTKYADELQSSYKQAHELQSEENLLRKEAEDILLRKHQDAYENVVSSSEISVLISIPEATLESGIVEVKMSYTVQHCSWEASYDLRVNKSDNVADLSYYGRIVNGSGEDWNDVQIFLSTAKPSRGGTLPRLARTFITYLPKETPEKFRKMGKAQKRVEKISVASDETDDESLCSSEDDLDRMEEIALDGALPNIMDGRGVKQELEEIVSRDKTLAEDRGGSATFRLNRLCSIESDNVPHKQNISGLTLKPRFSYVVSPEISSTAYLRCTARNDSEFILVKGDMNVFFNGSFVTSTKLKFVNKNQEFKVFLGKEESIKIMQGPRTSKRETVKGGLRSSKLRRETFSRKIRIKNTRQEHIEVQLFDQLPLSRDKRIKVNILSPNMSKKKKKEGYRLNFMNHLEVRRLMKPGQMWDFTFTYQVEWPKNSNLVYTESLENVAR